MNLARMKVYHEGNDLAKVTRSDSNKMSKLLKRKLAIKGTKSKADKRKSMPADIKFSEGTDDALNSDEATSGDSHDSEKERHPMAVVPVVSSRPRVASLPGEAGPSLSDDSRERSESGDSNLSEDAVAVDENDDLHEDRKKAIAVLKRIHPSRVCFVAEIF